MREVANALETNFAGDAARALRTFYGNLPSLPETRRPELLTGLGYNFEYYDALFALIMSNTLLSMSDGAYTPRYRAAQFLLRPFCSEYGIEAGRPLTRTHRELYAEFYQRVVGRAMEERYPAGNENPWLAVSRRWADRMKDSLMRPGRDAWNRAAYNIGYHWAVERLSLLEFLEMREAWNGMGFQAPYLDAHCSVEEEHGGWAEQALVAFADPEDPVVQSGIRTHEEHLAGYYHELSDLQARL
jgi:hypothetical protein